MPIGPPITVTINDVSTSYSYTYPQSISDKGDPQCIFGYNTDGGCVLCKFNNIYTEFGNNINMVEIINTITISARRGGTTKQVIGIADEVFMNNTTVEVIVIPDTIQFIGARAFLGCTSLTKIIFNGNNIPTIYNSAFDSPNNITLFYNKNNDFSSFSLIDNKKTFNFSQTVTTSNITSTSCTIDFQPPVYDNFTTEMVGYEIIGDSGNINYNTIGSNFLTGHTIENLSPNKAYNNVNLTIRISKTIGISIPFSFTTLNDNSPEETVHYKPILDNNIIYNIIQESENTIKISYILSESPSIEIPSHITSNGTNYIVTTIEGTGTVTSTTTSIVIPETITTIESNVFTNASSLDKIYFLGPYNDFNNSTSNIPPNVNIKMFYNKKYNSSYAAITNTNITHIPFTPITQESVEKNISYNTCSIQWSDILETMNNTSNVMYTIKNKDGTIYDTFTNLNKYTFTGLTPLTTYNFTILVNLNPQISSVDITFTTSDTSPSVTQDADVSLDIPISNICFPAGTTIVTDQEMVSIENIKPDFHTILNKKILFVTMTKILDDYLICFDKNALGINYPSCKTLMSKDHNVLYNGKMVKAKYFVGYFDGVKKIKHDGEPLYNVLLKTHETMIVNNLIVETLHPKNIIARLYLGNFTTEYKNKLIGIANNAIISGNVEMYKHIMECV